MSPNPRVEKTYIYNQLLTKYPEPLSTNNILTAPGPYALAARANARCAAAGEGAEGAALATIG